VVRPRFVEVVVRHDRVDVDVVTGPDAVQQYQLKGEGVMDRGLDTIKSRRGKELGRAEFGAADVDWAKLPSVARDALDRLPGAQVSHVKTSSCGSSSRRGGGSTTTRGAAFWRLMPPRDAVRSRALRHT
jgi:hypothetical protein